MASLTKSPHSVEVRPLPPPSKHGARDTLILDRDKKRNFHGLAMCVVIIVMSNYTELQGIQNHAFFKCTYRAVPVLGTTTDARS